MRAAAIVALVGVVRCAPLDEKGAAALAPWLLRGSVVDDADAAATTTARDIFAFVVVCRELDLSPRHMLDAGEDSLPGFGDFRVYSNTTLLPGVSDHPLCHGCVEAAVDGPMEIKGRGWWNSALNTPLFEQV